MKCTNCGASLSDSAKFCTECGTKVVRAVFCAECGTKLEAGAKFCPECGTKVGGAASAQAPAAKDESYPKDNGSSKWLTIEDDVLTECDGEAEGVVIIPEGVTVIEEGTFGGCDDITEIVIPRSVEQINGDAFSCEGLCSIKVASGNMNYKSEDGVLYTKDGKTLCRYPEGKKGGSFTVPDGVIRIENSAFDSCSNLESVTLRNGVTSIGEDAFNYCKALESVKIPDSVESIGESAFSRCEALNAINVAKGNDEYKSRDGVLYSADGKTLLRYPSGKDDDSFTVPDGVKTIGDNAFDGCESLKSIELPDGLKTIGDNAFDGCESLKSIELPDGLETIGDSAFDGCESLESIEFPDGLETIGDSAFHGCESLKSIELPDGLKTIGEWAFYKCNAFESIEFPDGLETIGDYAFLGCDALESIEFPDSVKTIGSSSFDASALKQIRYEGTTDEWKEIEIGEQWLENFGADGCEVKKVRCSDGSCELFKEENEIPYYEEDDE